MQLVDGRLVFSPSDISAFVACGHLAQLQRLVALGRLEVAPPENPQAELIREKGDAHERAHLEQLRREGREVIEIPDGDWLDAARATEEAIRAGAPVIYQATFMHDGWRGRADFLELQPDGRYEAVDTKLARRAKPAAVLQLCFYTQEIARIQGREPELMHLELGSGLRESFRYSDFSAYFRRVRARFLEFVSQERATYPYPVDHCSLCDFVERCNAQWDADDHLVRVAGIRKDAVVRLNAAGIARLAELAVARDPVPRMVPSTFERLRLQAALQLHERTTGEHIYRLLQPEEKRGLAMLPKPSRGDLFFDIEGDPFWAADRGLEYLFGIVWVEDGEPRFRAFWAHDRDQEKRAFEELVDFLHERLATDPDLHVYHYAPYETTALKRLAAQHATREEEVDALLRREAFVDLYRVVVQSLRASRPGYGLKLIEAFYLDGRAALVTGGTDSTIAYERWRETGDQALLDEIAAYNEEDCVSTLQLRDWLLDRRTEAAAEFGAEIAWREPPEVRFPSPEAEEARTEKEELRARLHERGDELLANLLDYHRREAKPGWWAFFRRLTRTSAELVDDSEAIGELEPDGTPPEELARSHVFRFTFPAQQHKLDARDDVVDPLTGKSAGWILELDDAAGTLALVRGPGLDDVALPRALIPTGPYDTRVQQAALRRVARSVLAGDGRYAALERILRREPPLGGRRVQRSTIGETKALVDEVEGSYLFVQGPPGSGKTWTAAQLIAHLLARGKRIGVSSTSHKAIHNLLDEVEDAVTEPFRGLKKSSGDNPESVYEGKYVESEKQIDAFRDPEVRLLAGTSWLFAHEKLEQQVDYLFVDEAGQVSLADALALGTSARTLVLLGDPLQLAQVTQGIHPAGSGASVLAHLLGDDRTVPEDRGLFLEQSRRMHPDVCRFVSEAFYEGRLDSAVRPASPAGTGLRYLPVEHMGNRQSSEEEAEAIRAELERLRGLGVDDVMVVAPYNAQVRCLRAALPPEVRVGTVDKFQGQEADVVFFSMASSSGEDIPRGLEFLFSRNRLNVAISRARCLAYLVCSPRLLEVECRTIEQMRLANALCQFVELASLQSGR
jgi:predicted RecB family nuclease